MYFQLWKVNYIRCCSLTVLSLMWLKSSRSWWTQWRTLKLNLSSCLWCSTCCWCETTTWPGTSAHLHPAVTFNPVGKLHKSQLNFEPADVCYIDETVADNLTCIYKRELERLFDCQSLMLQLSTALSLWKMAESDVIVCLQSKKNTCQNFGQVKEGKKKTELNKKKKSATRQNVQGSDAIQKSSVLLSVYIGNIINERNIMNAFH